MVFKKLLVVKWCL